MSILWGVEDSVTIIQKPLGIIKVGTVNCGNGVYLLKAGTPISDVGAVANAEDAKYLVAEDFYFYSNTPTQAKVVPLIAAGYVDLEKAQAAAGITYIDAAKTALATAGIILVDGALEAGGGGGSGVLVAHATVTYEDLAGLTTENSVVIEIDKTFVELREAEFSVVHIDATYEGSVALSLDFPRMAWAESLIFGLGDSAIQLVGFPYNLAVVVDLDDGETVAYLTALPASGGGDEPFVVTLTPTAADMSGTMDKTPAEILSAYMAHKDIKIRVSMENDTYVEFSPSEVDVVETDGTPTSAKLSGQVIYSPDSGVTNYVAVFISSIIDSTYIVKMYSGLTLVT